MDRPFREIHELYRINFLRVQAKKEADEEEERKKKEGKDKTNSQIARHFILY